MKVLVVTAATGRFRAQQLDLFANVARTRVRVDPVCSGVSIFVYSLVEGNSCRKRRSKRKGFERKEMGSRCAGVAERSQTLHARPKADPKTFLVNERALSALCWALNHVEEAEGGLVSQKQAKRISLLQFLSLSFSIQLPFAYLIFTHNNQFWQMSATTAGNYRLRK